MPSSAAVHRSKEVPKPPAAAIRRSMRIVPLLVCLPLLATFAPAGLFRMPPVPDRTLLAFDPVALDEQAPTRRRLGSLDYLGGWALRSNDQRFGGISAIHVAEGAVLALSDSGSVIRFTLPGPAIGRASCRERGCKSVVHTVGAVSLKQKQH